MRFRHLCAVRGLSKVFFRWRIDQRHGKKGSIIVEGFEDVHTQMIVDVWCSKCSNVYRLYVCICICDIFVYYMHVLRSGMTLFDIIFIYIYTYGYFWASINKVLCCCCLSILHMTSPNKDFVRWSMGRKDSRSHRQKFGRLRLAGFWYTMILGGGFKYFLFSPLFAEHSRFD